MNKLININKQTDNKYLNMYDLEYHDENTGINANYYVASRKEQENMPAITKDHTRVDGVMAIPMFHNDDLVLIKQFRPAINDYIYEFPAGLVEKNEDEVAAMKREVFEETGLTVVDYTRIIKPSYSSVGMSDESIAIYMCDVEGEITTEHTEADEDIEIVIVKMEDAKRFIEENNVCLRTSLIMTFLHTMNKFVK